MFNNDNFKEMRKFSQSILRDAGLGKQSLTGIVQDEAKHLTDKIGMHEGQTSAIQDDVRNAVFNVLNHIVFGKRYSIHEDYSTAPLNQS